MWNLTDAEQLILYRAAAWAGIVWGWAMVATGFVLYLRRKR